METIKGLHYRTLEPLQIAMQQGNIVNIIRFQPNATDDLPLIAPGLIDCQVNGYKGIDFNDPSTGADAIHQLTFQLLQQGVTTFFPTVITNTGEQLKICLSNIADACNQSDLVSACVGGIHLEGPFISPEDGPVGAHNKLRVRPPDWSFFEKLQQAAGGRIRIITLSPEWPGAASFTQRCVQNSVIVSIGHTAATGPQINEVVEAGAVMSTHLGNGTHQVLPRHPNYIWEQLAEDRLAATFIGDGFHLPPAVIKVIMKMKGGKCILVSDSVSLAGMSPGIYTTAVGGRVVLTKEGKLHLQNQPHTLAGSATTLLQAIENIAGLQLLPLSKSWELGSVNPARLLELPQQNGLTETAPADLVLFHKNSKNISIQTVYKGGKIFTSN